MEKKRIMRTLMGMVLAIAIAFAAIPQTASAASYSVGKLNTGAHAGKTYTIKTYFPGIGYQDLKVRYDSITTEDYYPSLYQGMLKKATVVMHCSFPKSTQNKIKNNAVKICRASKSRFSDILCGSYVIDANTGYTFNQSNATGKVKSIYSSVSDKKHKIFRQSSGYYRASYTLDTSWTINCQVVYNTSYEGNFLVGVAGTNKEVQNTSSKVTNFSNGYAPITSSAFFKNKMKKLSIWTRI